jgi:diguanylate cyclase (GGDEF)-like protein
MAANPSLTSLASAPVQDKELLLLLSQCANLPSPVGLAMRILELSRDPTVSLHQIAKVVSLDPALASKLLRLANSPLYARQRKTQNLRQAINLFGLEGTITLGLSFSVVSNLRDRCRQGFDYHLFWRRSLASATCAQLLAERMMVSRKEDLFLAGLLQDIGMLALIQVRADLYHDLGSQQSRHDKVRERERQVLGIDHAAIGAWLLQQWNFPEHLQTMVMASHDPEAAVLEQGLRRDAYIVSVAGDMAELWCNPGSQTYLAKLMGRAEQLLGLGREPFIDLLEKARVGMTEIADVFDIQLDDPRSLEILIGQARELTMLRHIRVMQKSSALERAAEQLETRTRRLEEESRRDTLTGLFNRAYLQQNLDEEIEAANRHGWPLAVMFVDLDDFKAINDAHGHLTGDQILRDTARILTEAMRASDVVARYGGEEFVVLLPGTGAKAAANSCERLLDALRSTRHPVGDDQELVVTASIGIAVHGEEGGRFDSVEDILRAADEALYSAKHQGRNRFVFYERAG